MLRHRVGLVFPVLFLLLVVGLDAFSEEQQEGRPSPQVIKPSGSCKALLVMDAQSGDVIGEYNAHQPLPPASMVKMMTAYLAMKRVDEHVASLSDIVSTSAEVSKIGGSQVYLKHKEEFTLGQLIEAVMIQSANDAAGAIAEFLGGSSQGFADMMNEEAKRLGMSDSIFHSPHGLPPAKGQEPDLTSAHDLALLARAIVKDFPQLIELSAKPEAYFRDGAFKMTNTNKLIHTFKGADGIKTGFYHKAGFCVTATAERNGVRIIAVVMGCENGRERFNEASRLLTLGFAKYKVMVLIKEGDAAPAAVPVKWGDPRSIVPIAVRDLKTSVKIGEDAKIEKVVLANPALSAPLVKGVSCGKIVFKLSGRTLGEVELVSPVDVPELGMFGKGLRLLKVK